MSKYFCLNSFLLFFMLSVLLLQAFKNNIMIYIQVKDILLYTLSCRSNITTRNSGIVGYNNYCIDAFMDYCYFVNNKSPKNLMTNSGITIIPHSRNLQLNLLRCHRHTPVL